MNHGRWQVMTRSVLMYSNCGVIEDCSECHQWSIERTHGCWTTFGLFWCRELVWRKVTRGSLATSSKKNSIEKLLMQGKVEDKRRTGRPTNTWFLGISQLAIDWKIWRELTNQSHSSADSTTWLHTLGERDKERRREIWKDREIDREREREGEIYRERKRVREI